MKFTKSIYWLASAVILLTACSSDGFQASLQPVELTIPSPPSSGYSFSETPDLQRDPSSEPRSMRINVPFSPQAPFATWDPLHEEACEEMSLIMVDKYWKGEGLTREQAEQEILALVSWETEHGYGEDTTAEETAQIARDYYGLKAVVRTDVTAETIKAELRNGRPVIIPAAGRDLGNPYFSGEGPWFHMLVITGYTDDGRFITNDPGTKRGENYVYDEAVLTGAIHDWTGVKERIREGGKAMVIVEGRMS